MDIIYSKKYANLNLFIPQCLYVHGLDTKKEGSSANNANKNISDIIDYIVTSTHPGLTVKPTAIGDAEFKKLVSPENGGFPSTDLALLQSIEGITFKELPFKKPDGTHILTTETGMAKNSNTIKFNFLLESDLHILSSIDKWRDLWYSESYKYVKVKNDYILCYKEGIQCLSDDKKKGQGQGIFNANYLNEKGEVKGQLWITGLIPLKIESFGKVGPGLDAQSSVATVSITCVYSIGFIHLNSGRNVYLV